MFFKNAESDSLIVKYHQFVAAKKAAQELMQQCGGRQTVAAYVALSALLLEIELELSVRQQHLAAYGQ